MDMGTHSFPGLAPKGRDISAQGKRGGAAAKRRPGKRMATRQALKGRDKNDRRGQSPIVSPFQGFLPLAS